MLAMEIYMPLEKLNKITGIRKANSPAISARKHQIYFLIIMTNIVTAKNHTEVHFQDKGWLIKLNWRGHQHSIGATWKHLT
jgi:hypothetical protein